MIKYFFVTIVNRVRKFYRVSYFRIRVTDTNETTKSEYQTDKTKRKWSSLERPCILKKTEDDANQRVLK